MFQIRKEFPGGPILWINFISIRFIINFIDLWKTNFIMIIR
jgi:hypothetical protein